MIPRSCLVLLANKKFFPLEKVKILRKFSKFPLSEARFWNFSKSQAPQGGGGTQLFQLFFAFLDDSGHIQK